MPRSNGRRVRGSGWGAKEEPAEEENEDLDDEEDEEDEESLDKSDDAPRLLLA